MRWLLLDEVTVIEKKVRAKTRSRVPQSDVSPELLMMEMMAQTGALLLGAENDFQSDLVFAKIQEAVFDGGFRAGEGLEIEATSENLRPEGAWLEGAIRSAGGRQARGSFLLMNVGKLVAERTQSITFHEAFMNHFQIRDKVR